MHQFEEAVNYLAETLQRSEAYREELATDPALQPLKNYDPFIKLLAR